MWISLLAALTLAAAPATSPQAPITVLLAPPDAAGAPSHVVEFAQEHVAEQLKSRGLQVVRIEDVTRKLSASKRRALLRCNRTAPACIKSLGTVGKSEAVLVTELGQLRSGYRAGARMYAARDGKLITEHLVPGVREDRLLDSLTQALDIVVPRTQTALRGTPAPGPRLEMPPPPETPVAEVKPPVAEPPPSAVTPPTPSKPEATKPVAEVTTPASGARVYPLRRWAWLPAAGGVALAGAGTFFYLRAGSKNGELTDPDKGPVANPDEVESSGRQAQTLSRVTYGLGAAALGAAVVMYLLPGDAPPKVQPSAAVVPGGGMVGLSGTWP